MKEVKDILKGCLVNDSMDLDKAMGLLEKEPPVAGAINIYDMSEETEQTSSADDEHDVQSTIDNTDSKIAMYLKDIILPEIVYTIFVTVFLYPCILLLNKTLEDTEKRGDHKLVKKD